MLSHRCLKILSRVSHYRYNNISLSGPVVFETISLVCSMIISVVHLLVLCYKIVTNSLFSDLSSGPELHF